MEKFVEVRYFNGPFVFVLKEGKGFKQRSDSITVVFLKDPSGSKV